MKKLLCILIIIGGIHAYAQNNKNGLWDFQKPQGGFLKIQDLLGENFYISDKVLILAYNNFSLRDGYKTSKGLHYAYLNLGLASCSHIHAIEMNVVDSVIIQIAVYVKKEEKYYVSWRKDMIESGFKRGNIHTEMESEIDKYFNEKVDALYLIAEDLDPNMILYSLKEKEIKLP